MKLALLTARVPPAVDGVGDYSWHLARTLRGLGVEVRIITSRDQRVNSADQSWIHPVIARWSGESVSREIQKIFDPDWCSFQFVPHLYGRHGICFVVSGVPADLKKTLGCRTSVTFHEVSVEGKGSVKKQILRALMLFQARKMIEGSDLVLTSTERYAGWLRRIAASRSVEVVPVGPNIPPVAATREELDHLRHAYGFFRDTKIIGLFGRMAPFRNFRAPLLALSKAAKAGLKVSLLMIGCAASSNPRLFSRFMKEAKDFGVEKNIRVTGEMKPEEVSRHLQLLDLFLFPQIDGLTAASGTTVSAIVHGLPILSYPPVSGNFNGLEYSKAVFVPEGDDEAYAQKALEMIQSPQGGREAALPRTDEFLRDYFSWNHIARSYLEKFESISHSI